MPAWSCRVMDKLVHCLIILQRPLWLNSVSSPVGRAASFPLKWARGKQAVLWIIANSSWFSVTLTVWCLNMKSKSERENFLELCAVQENLCQYFQNNFILFYPRSRVCVTSNLGWLLLSVLLLGIHGKSFHWESYMVLLSFSAFFRGHLFFQPFGRVVMLYISLQRGSDKVFSI